MYEIFDGLILYTAMPAFGNPERLSDKISTCHRTQQYSAIDLHKMKAESQYKESLGTRVLFVISGIRYIRVQKYMGVEVRYNR